MPSKSCPNNDSCRCVEHHPGLGEFAPNPVAYAAALDAIRPVRLRVVTMPVEMRTECEGTMTCPCSSCEKDRERVRKRRPVRQPWGEAA